MNINNLKRQHQEIGQLINEIESFLTQDVVPKAFEISLKIGALAGKLSIHLKSEDNCLYPSLLVSEDELLKKIANLFNQEMSYIAQAFLEYKTKYMSSTGIKQNSTQFTAETLSIISHLRIRLNNEDKELFPLVENL